MPHIIIEHSFLISKPQIDNLLLGLNQAISKNDGGFSIFECKARAMLCNNFIVAEGSVKQDFMHIEVRIMAGRSLEIRQNLAKNLLKMAEQFLNQNNLSNNKISLSINIVEMDKDIYQKTIINAN